MYIKDKIKEQDMERLSFSKYFKDEYFPIYVRVMSQANTGSDYVPPHSHEFAELVIITSGRLRHSCGGEETWLGKGDFFLIHPGMTHSYSQRAKGTVLYNLIYDSRIPIPMLMTANLPFLQILYPPEGSHTDTFQGVTGRLKGLELERTVDSLNAIRIETRKRLPGHHILVLSLFMEIIINLSRYYSAPTLSSRNWALNKVIAYMKCHYTDKITTSHLAKIAGMSERTLLRNFKALFGIGSLEYLIDFRIRQAIVLLQSTNLTFEEIAIQTGFCNYSHMWRLFKDKMKLTPSEIRDRKTPGHQT